MSIDKETIKSIGDYISRFIILIAPGIILVEVVLNKGFISGGIQNLFDLVLLIIWSVILSIPYYPLVLFLSARFEYDNPSELEKIEIDDPLDYESMVALVVIITLINCAAYLIIKFYYTFSNILLGIEANYLIFLVSMFITFLIALPVGGFYFWLINCIVKNIHKAISKKAKRKKDS